MSGVHGFHRQDCADSSCVGCFTVPPPAAPLDESPDRRRTRQRRELLEIGINPGSKRRLISPEWGYTCGDCEWHGVHRLSGTYHKCGKAPGGVTGGPATDVRVGWPACELFRLEVAQS